MLFRGDLSADTRVREIEVRFSMEVSHLLQLSTFSANLYGLVVRVSDYRSRGPGFDSRRYQIFWEVVGLERGPLSLVRITEELLEW
jgi:hypothetical protein